jgi:S1-C subfamily serine protease
MTPSEIGPSGRGTKRRVRTAVIASMAAVLVICVLAFALAGCTVVTSGGTTSTSPATTATTAVNGTTGTTGATGTTSSSSTTTLTPAENAALASPAETVAAKLGPSVVNIKVSANVQQGGVFGNQPYSAEASGVIYTSDGMIITNNHVVTVEGTDQLVDSVQVTLATGEVLAAKVIGHDSLTDLAVIKVTSAKPLPAATFLTSQAIVGDYAVAIGSPLGFANSVTLGIVSGLNRSLDQLTGSSVGAYVDLIQTDAAISPGNSGGALGDAAGRVIGINVAYAPPGSTGAENIGFAIPALLVTNIADQIIKSGKASHVYIGVSTQTVTTDLQKQFSLGRSTGALIAQVSTNSPASKAGLKQGDIIIKVGDKDVTNSSDVLVALRTNKPGDTIQVVVDRNGSTLTIPVVVQERPAGT